MVKIYRQCVLLALVLLFSSPGQADFDCGQNWMPTQTYKHARVNVLAEDPVVIDYAVFYTPEAREAQGGTDRILERITAAFSDANQLFSLSGSAIVHRVVHTQELPINNISQTLPELGTELATQFDYFSVLDAVHADTSVTIVNFQIPGGFANIPTRPGLASRGGTIYLGLQNVSGGVLAHEIGHTLGASHDYPDSQSLFFDLPRTYGYGNHFIGMSGTCYRTIMSALTNCRVVGFSGATAIQSSRFSSPSVIFDGVPTGDPINADSVRLFAEFAPFLASSRNAGSTTPEPQPSPPSSLPPDNGGSGDDGSADARNDLVTLSIERSRGRVFAKGMCVTLGKTPLTGDPIQIVRVNRRTESVKILANTTCSARGRYRVVVIGEGRIRALNARTGTQSSSKRL